MDENNKEIQSVNSDSQIGQAPIIETPQAAVTNSAVKVNGSGHRNLILAIAVLVIGAVIISAIIVVAYPKQSNTDTTSVPATQTKEVTAVSKTSDLNTATTELNATDLDSYKTELNQIDSAASSF